MGKNFVQEELEKGAKHVPLEESRVAKAAQRKLRGLMEDKIKLDEAVKELEAKKKGVQDEIWMIMKEAEEEAVEVEGVGKVTMVRVKGREKFDRPKMIKVLVGEGVKEAVINKALGAAITVGEPTEYVKVTGVKE